DARRAGGGARPERRERLRRRRRGRRGAGRLGRADPRRNRPRAAARGGAADGGGELVRGADAALARTPRRVRRPAVTRVATAARIAARRARDPLRWARIAAARPVPGVHVYYGRDRMPGRDEPAYGGL